MTALTKARTVKSIPGLSFAYPVLANAVIYQGAIVVITSAGWAKPGVTGLGLTTVGVAREGVNNTGGSNGALIVEVDERIADMANSAGADEIAAGDVGKVCYLVDDQTVAKTDGGTAQVTTLTIVYDSGSATGFNITGVGTLLTVNAATNGTATALALANKANSDGSFNAQYIATPSGATIAVAKRTAGAFTITKVVGGSADITQTTEPAGVAATRSRAGYVRKLDGSRVYVEFTNKIASAA